MFTEMMTVTGYMFWGVVLVFVLVETMLLYNDMDETPLPVFLGFAALLLAALFTDLFKGTDLLTLGLLALAYVVLGVLWSIKKWYDYLVTTKKRLISAYDAYNANVKYDSVNTREVALRKYVLDGRPEASKNKSRLVTWMVLWPFSLSWWVLTYPRRLFDWIYDRLTTVYDRISQKVFEVQ